LKGIENEASVASGGAPKHRRVRDKREGVPAVEFEFTVTFHCELLEGDAVALDRIASEFADYLQRRDDQIGLIAARDWALLVDRAWVRPGTSASSAPAVIDVRRAARD